MAARRLIIVMLVLLGISTALAIVTPAPPTDDPQEEAAITGKDGDPDPQETGKAGESPSKTVRKEIGPGDAYTFINVGSGERLILTVNPKAPGEIEIPGLGLIQTATKYSPAVFDVILPPGQNIFHVIQVGGDHGNLGAITTGLPRPKPPKG